MADERHQLDVKPDELLAEVRALRILVEAMLHQLPDMAIKLAISSIKDHARRAETMVRNTQNDRWQDYTAVAYDMAGEIEDSADRHMQERDEGQALTTIQEVPLSPEEARLRSLRDDD